MKRGLLLFIIILLYANVALSIGPAPEFQVDDDGNLIPIGHSKFDPDNDENTYTQEGNDLGEVEVFTKQERCPVVFDAEKVEGKRQFKPFYAGIDADGSIIHPDKAGLKKQSPRDVAPINFKENEGGTCGTDFEEARPFKPKYSPRNETERFSYDRAAINAENGIGVGYEDGKPVPKNPTVKQGIESGKRPPNLPYPPPEYVFAPQGYVTYETTPEDIKIMVVLVQFPDEKAKVSVSEIEDMFFGAENSLASYLSDQSYGQVTVSGEVIPTWYTLSQDMGYYGGNYEANVEEMIVEAIYAADPDVDFSEFDQDNDGVIDSFFVVHSGAPDEAGGGNQEEIWSHYYSIPPVTADGIKVIDYETVSEESPLGITIHEFGHYLGLPDLYDTVYDDGSSKGVGDWSIMGYGGYLNHPGSFDPWSKYFLGWLNDDNFLSVTESGSYDLSQSNIDYGIRYYLAPLTTSEYFMLENREVHDLMKSSKSGGVLIWHIDEEVMDEKGSWNGCSGTRWDCNTVNGNAEQKLIDVEEADGKEDLSGDGYGDDEDPWYNSCSTFGGCQPYLFYSSSNPDSGSYYGAAENNIAINVDSEIGGTMSVGISLEGEILSSAVREEISSSESTSSSAASTSDSSSAASSSSNGVPSWVWIIIGLLGIVIIGGGIAIALVFSKKGQITIGPKRFKPFEK
jgi:M6 family metalloprotease-like protein